MTGAVVWHDVECGSYAADLALWRELAAAADGPVLDVGAGTGRVALDLARRGVEVVALDADGELLAELARRAADLPVRTVRADARALAVTDVALIIVPMQTLQLLGGPPGRAAFLRAALRALRPGGLLAAALADARDGLDAEHDLPPLPDIRQLGDGTVVSSRVVAVRADAAGATIERLRETVDPAGRRSAAADAITLDRVDARTVAAEARALGFAVRPTLAVAPTDEHVGSEVVVLCRP